MYTTVIVLLAIAFGYCLIVFLSGYLDYSKGYLHTVIPEEDYLVKAVPIDGSARPGDLVTDIIYGTGIIEDICLDDDEPVHVKFIVDRKPLIVTFNFEGANEEQDVPRLFKGHIFLEIYEDPRMSKKIAEKALKRLYLHL